MKPQVVVWGAGGHALVVADTLRAAGEYELAGFLLDEHFHGSARPQLRSSLLGGRAEVVAVRESGVAHAVVAVGDCNARLEIAEMLLAAGFQMATAVHPSAVVAPNARIAAGTVIAAGAVVNPGAVVGESCIINTGATVDHECEIADGAHISPGTHLAGNVRVGRATWIGIGAAVINNIRVGSHSLIGAGAVVVEDIPDGVVAYGVPARIVKENRAAHER